MKIYPKRILNVEISSTGIHKVWFLKYLGVTYLILVLASSFILLFLHRSIFDREKESFNEKVEYLFNSSFFNESNNIEDVLTKLKKVVFDADYQKQVYDTSERICNEHHTLENSNLIFEKIVNKAIRNYTKSNVKE